MSIPGQKLRGFVGQSMDGRRVQNPSLVGKWDLTSGSGSITFTSAGTLLVYQWGTGGGGARAASPGSGGGGAALYARVRVSPGQKLTYSIGTPGVGSGASNGTAGGDTIVDVVGRNLFTGGGGAGLVASDGIGGVARGGDVNVSGNPGLSTTGGTAGGFASISGGELAGGAGGAASTVGTAPGGGGGGSPGATGGNGATGRVFAVLLAD